MKGAMVEGGETTRSMWYSHPRCALPSGGGNWRTAGAVLTINGSICRPPRLPPAESVQTASTRVVQRYPLPLELRRYWRRCKGFLRAGLQAERL